VQTFEKYQADIRLVFMDVMMPVMGGSEAAKHIEELRRKRRRFCEELLPHSPLMRFQIGYSRSQLDG